MDNFFRMLAGLPNGQNHWIAVGIDGRVTGEKAIFAKDEVLYQTDGFPKEVQKLLLEQPECGLLTTPWGRIFVEHLGTRKKVILCGGGHVSSAVLSIAKMLEFHVTVLEDRPDFARTARLAGADEVICADFAGGLKRIQTDADTYIIIMTRGHRHDLDCLHQLLNREYAYLGMMGSRARVRRIREQLQEEGFDQVKLEGLHAPIGLSIGAETPAEIAVSVMAEMIREKNQGRRVGGYEKEVADWLFAEERFPKEQTESGQSSTGQAVLSTIIARKGSAPRQIGTKMLIFPDGSSLGTIGGGCMEAEVKAEARHMLAAWREKGSRYKTCMVDMTGQDAEEEGMVCGGIQEIFLEIL